MTCRIKIVCPSPAVPVYDAIVDGVRIGSWSSSLDAETAASSYLRSEAARLTRELERDTHAAELERSIAFQEAGME